MTVEFINHKDIITDSGKERGIKSVNNVIELLSDQTFFPWVYSIQETAKNGYLDAHEKIDLVVHTDDPFCKETGLDSIALQVKSSEKEMTQFLGVLATNGKTNKHKFMKKYSKEWVDASMIYVDGQWPKEMIKADIMYQTCSLLGLWPNMPAILNFAETHFPVEAEEVLRKTYIRISDYRGLFLDWVSKSSQIIV